MKRILLIAFLSVASLHSNAQGKYGFEAGIGYSTIKKSYITPTLQSYYLARLSRTFYAGGGISFQRYSFFNTLNPATPAFGDVLSIRQSSDYLFFMPRAEMGFGVRKHWFATFCMGPGIYVGGAQWRHEYQPLWITPGGIPYGTDTTNTNTAYNVPNLIFRISAGLKQRIPTYRYWNIVISEEFTYLPGVMNKVGPGMKTNYLSLTVGIMHKYPVVTMEDD